MIDYRFFYSVILKKTWVDLNATALDRSNDQQQDNLKNRLSLGTEVPDDQAVLCIEFTCRTIAASLFL